MYTPVWMKFSRRWRRLAWRLNTTTYAGFVGSTIISLLVVRHYVTALGNRDTYRNRVAANGSYKRRRFVETDDNPLYRLPEQPQSGHRLDGLSTWAHKAQHFVSH